ncbi:MAG: hypothetical protein H8E48_14085 [Chloroflexi bacterium]|nr:hypothetical protein [Chloroflexota bacterium]
MSRLRERTTQDVDRVEDDRVLLDATTVLTEEADALQDALRSAVAR